VARLKYEARIPAKETFARLNAVLIEELQNAARAACHSFPEADHLDPFALGPQRRRAAWGKAFVLLGSLVREVHRRDTAMTWPKAELWGFADTDYKPWRTVATLDKIDLPTACPFEPDEQKPPFPENETGDRLLKQYLQWLNSSKKGAKESEREARQQGIFQPFRAFTRPRTSVSLSSKITVESPCEFGRLPLLPRLLVSCRRAPRRTWLHWRELCLCPGTSG
jgi:hypothetical protein